MPVQFPVQCLVTVEDGLVIQTLNRFGDVILVYFQNQAGDGCGSG